MTDNAGNFKFARTWVMFDPDSEVEIQNSIVLDIAFKTSDYQWTSNTDKKLVYSWSDTFANVVRLL